MQAIAVLETAKRLELITSKEQCEDIAGDGAKFADLVYRVGFGPIAGEIARVIAGYCGRCACGHVF